MRILFVGDVVGRPGREAVAGLLPRLRAEHDVDLCVVNGENVADGVGITPRLAEQLLGAGADAITLGNHTWRRQEIAGYLNGSERVVRPANMASTMPGRGLAVVPAANGSPVAVVNVLGSLFLDPAHSMWELIDDLVDEAHADDPRRRGRRPRRGDEREGRARELARRSRDRSDRDAHARPDGAMRACSRRARPRSRTSA